MPVYLGQLYLFVGNVFVVTAFNFSDSFWYRTGLWHFRIVFLGGINETKLPPTLPTPTKHTDRRSCFVKVQ